MATYLDLIADLAVGRKVLYADLPKADRDHVRSLASDGFAETHAGNGRRVLKSHESAYVRLTPAGMSYAAALQAAGVILAPLQVPAPPAPQPKAETTGRHAKPSAYADIDQRIESREVAAKKNTARRTNSSRKAGKVTTTKVAPKTIAPRQILDPQDLNALRRIAALLPSIDNFTDQFQK